jgi:predicted porin
MAQVTLTGNVNFRFATETSGVGTQTKGIGISDSSLSFSTSEDLGGGLKLSAKMGIENFQDGTSTVGTGAVIGLTSASMGSVAFSNAESGDFLGMDAITNSAFSNGSINDRIAYTSPAFSGVTVGVTYQDGGNAQAHSVGNTAMIYGIAYANGPLTANVDMLKVEEDVNAATDNGSRWKVGYDLGMAKVSYGQVNSKSPTAVKRKETALSISVPMGALTLSATAAGSKVEGATKLDGTELTASYALSKRTSFVVQKRSYDTTTAGVSPERTRVTLSHNF